MYSCQECCVVFSGVKLSIRSFLLFHYEMDFCTECFAAFSLGRCVRVCVCVCVGGGGGGGGSSFLNGNANWVLS